MANPFAANSLANFLLFFEIFLSCLRGSDFFIVFGLISLSLVCSLFGLYFTLLSIVIFLNVIYFNENINNISFITRTIIRVCILWYTYNYMSSFTFILILCYIQLYEYLQLGYTYNYMSRYCNMSSFFKTSLTIFDFV